MRKIETIDCDYLYPRFAASYLVHEGAHAYFVETNTVHAVPKMLDALKRTGLSPEQVEFILITHVHLDHSAGAHALMQACPKAKLLCHPRAQKHLLDPSRLEASARQVYGNERFDRLYGKLSGIDPYRVISPEDEQTVRFAGGGELRFLHTRGHANHHFCIHDPVLDGIFTGDSFGLAYPALQNAGHHIFPSTSPTEFDAAEAQRSVRRIAGSGAKTAYLTHFGPVTWISEARNSLLEQLDFSEELWKRALESELSGVALAQFCDHELMGFLRTFWKNRGFTTEQWELMRLDLELNAAGIAYSAEKGRSKPTL